MKNINKFMILVGILLNFSVVNAEVKEIESLDQISNEIVGGKTNKKVNIKNLKNNSESFTYTFGLLFEMARVLKNAKDENGYVYYDVN